MQMKLKIETVDDLVLLIQVSAWAFVVFVVLTVFGGTVFAMLYSVIFIQQPIKAMSPIDAAFTKMLNDIVLLLTGSITTLVGMFAIIKGAKALANKLAPAILPQQPSPLGFNPQPNLYGAGMGSAYVGGAMMSPMGMPQQQQFGMVNQPVVFDNSWTPPPPPVNPPHHLEDDDERQAMAAARESVK
jgi:hypothetical protein